MNYHSLGCKKQRVPLDLRPIASGLVWLRARKVRRAHERKRWLWDSINRWPSDFPDTNALGYRYLQSPREWLLELLELLA
jgi:hypothetical protein